MHWLRDKPLPGCDKDWCVNCTVWYVSYCNMSQKTVLLPYEKYKRLLESAISPSSDGELNEPQTPATTSLKEDIILACVPAGYRKRVQSLLDFIRSGDVLVWSEKGQLVCGSDALPGSQIVDLLRDAQCTLNQSRCPAGTQEFYRAMGKYNIPLSLIKNVTRHPYLRNQPSPSASISREKGWTSW